MSADRSAAAPRKYIQDADFTLWLGDVREVLAQLPDGSVDCCVTSPPYWGLRDYGTGTWEGGDPDCDHLGKPFRTKAKLNENWGAGYSDVKNAEGREPMGQSCSKCGAMRVDRQIGLEQTPEQFVAELVAVFREVRRVLAPHGTCWLNLGDSYASGGGLGAQGENGQMAGRGIVKARRPGNPNKNGGNSNRDGVPCAPGLKPKDLVGIPWSVAKALQQPYYTGRIAAERDRVWLAAMLDGEGTICGFRHERPDGNIRTGCLTFITNSSERILDECDRIWPGSRYTETLKPGDQVLGGTATRPCWRWELQSAEDRSALVRELYPYLVEKQRQALVAWNLLEMVQAAKRMGRGGETPAIKEKRDHLVRLLSDLNQKRPVDLPSWLAPVPDLYEPGWYLRSDVIWSKNNPMPESVTDRPTKAHEYIFLLTKQPHYFFDQEAVREPVSPHSDFRERPDHATAYSIARAALRNGETTERLGNGSRGKPSGRNVRSVWEIATQPYPEAHFATYPEALVERCVKAGCPEWVCRTCGKPRERIVEATLYSSTYGDSRRADAPESNDQKGAGEAFGTRAFAERKRKEVATLGWSDCGHNNYRPGLVLDPFMGSGTTALVARRLGRHSIGVDLNESYAELCARRLQQLSLLAEGAA